jgi:hypothetical protein
MAVTAPKSGRPKGKDSSKESSGNMTVEAVPFKRNSAYFFFLSALPGIIIAVAATIWSRGAKIEVPLKYPSPGSWTYGFYTTEAVPEQSEPSTHALLYPNGGGGQPLMVSFENNEEFLKLGRLYNDLGQIVQSPSHFLNGTALYRGPEKTGTHFQWPAGEYIHCNINLSII